MSKTVDEAIKKVREEIEEERKKLNELEDGLNNLVRKKEKENSMEESEIKKTFIRD